MRLGKFVVEWRHPLGLVECPYAYRWRLDFYFFSFRLHKWLGSDDERAYHNHPWHFFTYVLKGYYVDVTPDVTKMGWSHYNPVGNFPVNTKRWAWRNKDHKHYVVVPVPPAWSFIVTFGSPKRYAFWDVLTGKRKNRDKYFIENGHPPCE